MGGAVVSAANEALRAMMWRTIALALLVILVLVVAL
jgi:hypothetical protein